MSKQWYNEIFIEWFTEIICNRVIAILHMTIVLTMWSSFLKIKKKQNRTWKERNFLHWSRIMSLLNINFFIEVFNFTHNNFQNEAFLCLKKILKVFLSLAIFKYLNNSYVFHEIRIWLACTFAHVALVQWILCILG